MTRAALVIALTAAMLAGGALAAALHRPPSPFGLVCGMQFTDGQTGHAANMFVPCSPTRP